MKLKSYLKLCRVSNLPTVWTNVLAALVLSGSFSLGNFLLLALSLSLFYSGGMCLNDFFDAEPDRLQSLFGRSLQEKSPSGTPAFFHLYC